MQDNNGFCGPSNSLDREGIKDDHWIDVVGGDGMWAVPDPADPNSSVTDLEDGRVSSSTARRKSAASIAPYAPFRERLHRSAHREVSLQLGFADRVRAVGSARSRGSAATSSFKATDRGEHWTPISPDLTRNVKEHQQPSGGPLAYDVSGAEYSDTLLYIEGSPLNKGEIWVGTDDGLVQLTRDGGASWKNVTPPGVPPYGRVEAAAPSPLRAGTAYATIDDIASGDYAPYAFVTHDYGKTWTSIAQRLAGGSIRAHDSSRHSQSRPRLCRHGKRLYVSYDGGDHWQASQLNLPPVSVRDMRMQPQFDDLVHRDARARLWILDDVTSLQQSAAAQAAGVMLFAPRTAYVYHFHSNDEGCYTRFAGQNPPMGAIVDFYQRKRRNPPPIRRSSTRTAPCFAASTARTRIRIRTFRTFRTRPASIATPGISTKTVRCSGWARPKKLSRAEGGRDRRARDVYRAHRSRRQDPRATS